MESIRSGTPQPTAERASLFLVACGGRNELFGIGRVLLHSRPEYKPHRRADKTECFANVVLQITLIRKVEQSRIVDEEDERRRRDAALRRVVAFQHMAAKRRRRPGSERIAHHLVQLRGGHALTALVSYRGDGIPNLVNALVRQGGSENYHRIGPERELAPQDLDCRFAIECFAVDQVDFVDHDDQPLAFLNSQAGDALILSGGADGGIDQKQAHIGSADCADRAQRAILLNRGSSFAMAADAGGVDDDEATIAHRYLGVRWIARRAGLCGNHCSRLTQQRVDQRRFAHIRLTDDGKVRNIFAVVFLVRWHSWQAFGYCIQQITALQTVNRRYG